MTFGNSLKVGFATIGNDMKVKSPEIFLGVGIICVVGGTLLACRNTLKIKTVLDDHNEMIEKINKFRGTPKYSEEDARQDTAVLYRNTIGDMAKAYAPVVALEVIGLGCILYSHKVLSDRYFGALSTINAMQLGLNAYRNRIKDKLGEQEEFDLFHNIKKELVEEEYIDEKGKKKTRMVEKPITSGEAATRFSYMFDRNSWGFKDMYSNKRFFNFTEKSFNEQLYSRGKDTGFSNMTAKEITDYFGWTEREKDQLALLTNGWIFRADEYNNYEHYDDGTPRIIHLGTNPAFGVTEAETWVDFDCHPILNDVGNYEKEVKKRNKKLTGRYIQTIPGVA